MAFLAPLFLLGALAVALPFWLHRLQTQSSERERFGSTMLLEPAERQVHVRRKLKYLLLLASRVTLLIIVALLFAKPILPRPAGTPVSGEAGTYLVLVDTSASMQRAGVFEAARSAAHDAIDSVPSGALIQVLGADADLTIGSELSADRSIHHVAVAALGASALRGDLGRTMAQVDRLAGSLPAPVRLHLVSDFQRSALPVRFADLVSPQLAELMLHRVGAAAGDNRRVEFVRGTAQAIDVGIDHGPRGDGYEAMIVLNLNGATVASRSVAASGRSVLRFSGLVPEAGDNRLTVRILADDDLAIDDRWFHVLENVPPLPVPLITADARGLPATYLSAALESDDAYDVEPWLSSEADFRKLSRYRWAVVDDVGILTATAAAQLKEFVETGGNLLAFVGERSAGAERLPISGHAIGPAGRVADPGDSLAVGSVDRSHPLLAEPDGWFGVHFERNLVIDTLPDDAALMRLDNGVPLLIERRLGRGTLLLLAAGLDGRWNDLPIRPVFVGFVVEAARLLSGADRFAKAFTAGDTLPLSLIGGASGQVIDPDGNTVLSLVDTTRAQQVELRKPGYYQVYTPQGDYVVAVNVDLRESNPEPAAAVTLDRWVRATGRQAGAGDAAGPRSESQPLELWRALLVALVLIVIGESLLGNAFLASARKT